MLTLDTQISGISETVAAARALRHLDGLYEAHDDALQILKSAAQDYPPRVPGSRYVRTEWLKGGWLTSLRQSGAGFDGRLFNSVRYAQWVMGDGTQAAVHQGRWSTVGQIADRLENRVAATIEAGADAWLTQAGW